MQMTGWILFGTALVALLASGRSTDEPGAGFSSPLLALPSPNIPLSFDQTEENTRELKNGEPATVVIKKTVYRDSSGRVRVQSDIGRSADTGAVPSGDLLDPVKGTRTLWSDAERVAYRLPFLKSTLDEGKFAVLGIGLGAGTAHKWTTVTEYLGTRIIDGFKFEGTRVIRTAEDEPQLRETTELWHSADLKLIGFLHVSGSNETHTVRIENLRRGEPDPTLFETPLNYKVQDLQLP